MTVSRLITPVLLTAAFIISLFYHGGQGTAYAPALILLLGAALASALPAMKRGIALPCGVAVIITLLFWIYVSLSLTWSSVPFASLVTWLNITALPLVLLTLLCHPARQDIFRMTVLMMGGVVLLAALYTLWQFFAQGMPRAPGVLANPNNMAALINLALLAFMAAFLNGDQRPVTGAASAILGAALLATGSRGGLLCLTVGLVILLVALWPQIKARRKLMAFSLAGVVVVMAMAAFMTLTTSPLAHNLEALLTPAHDQSTLVRWELWKASLAMLRDHLAGGTGLGTFYLYYPAYRPLADNASLGHFAHFDGLQFGIEAGVAALVLFYGMAGAWLFMGIRAIRQSAGMNRALVAGCFASLAALFLHAHIEFQFYILAILIFAGTLMAGLYAFSPQNEKRGYITLTPARGEGLIWRGALLLSALLMALTTASTASGYYFTARAEAQLRSGDLDGFFSTIQQTYRFAPRSFTDASLRVASVYLDILAQPPVQMTAADRQEIFSQTERLLQDAALANPALGDIDHKRAKLYMRGDELMVPDRLHRIELSWRTALKKDPLHTRAREEFARFLIAQGRVAEAYALVQEGLQRPGTRAAQQTFQTLAAQLEPLVALQQQFENTKPATP